MPIALWLISCSRVFNLKFVVLAKTLLITLALSFISVPVCAIDRVEILALFNERAVLLINGAQHLLKVGSSSPEGIRLLSATPKVAEIEWAGERQTLYLSRQISSGYTEAQGQAIAIPHNWQGQYVTEGAINGRTVQFLVDTGANVLAMNSHEAKNLGIDYLAEGNKITIATASGISTGYEIMLDSVSVGGIQVQQVKATVLEGDYPQVTLLGMTFLHHVDLRESSGIMYLEKDF